MVDMVEIPAVRSFEPEPRRRTTGRPKLCSPAISPVAMGAADAWALADDTQTTFILHATSAVVQSDGGSQQFRILADFRA